MNQLLWVNNRLTQAYYRTLISRSEARLKFHANKQSINCVSSTSGWRKKKHPCEFGNHRQHLYNLEDFFCCTTEALAMKSKQESLRPERHNQKKKKRLNL